MTRIINTNNNNLIITSTTATLIIQLMMMMILRLHLGYVKQKGNVLTLTLFSHLELVSHHFLQNPSLLRNSGEEERTFKNYNFICSCEETMQIIYTFLYYPFSTM